MISVSEMKALKRNRRVFVDVEDIDGEDFRTLFIEPLPAGPHAPNKNEARVLRSLMSRTGLNEQQIRQHKKYRRLLTDASRERGTKSPMQRYALRIRKQILQELQLPKEHPSVKAAFIARLEPGSSFRRCRLESAHSLWEALAQL
jgi:hypothetical protein